MANDVVQITEGSGKSIDTRTTTTNSRDRQVVVIGNPTVDVAVAEVASLDVGSSSTAYGQVVRVAGSVQINAVTGTLGVNLGKVDGTIQVNVGKISDTISVHIGGTGGTMAVNVGKVDGTVAVYLHSTGGTLGVRVGQIDGTTAVYLHSTGGTLGVDVGKINDNVSVKFASIPGTAGVNLGKVDGTIQVNVGKIDDLVAIKTTSASGTLGVHLLTTAGTITVKVGPESAVLVNAFHTASIFTTSGTTSGVSASGVTLVSPSANASFKVFAYSIQSTAALSQVFKFTNGAGTSPTEFWRPLITAGSVTGVQGANLAVTPPGYIFATGVSVTLALVGDGSPVHYSISYFKESA